MRFRYLFMALGSALALTALFLTDPLGGNVTLGWLLGAARFVFGVALVFFGFRAVSDYDEADGQELHELARHAPVGAGLALVYRGLVMVAMAIVFATVAGNAGAQDVRSTIPAQAPQHLPTLKALQRAHWPIMPTPWVLAGQIEKESCITLKHSRCWNATSRLKSAREEGAGLGQITRTWRADGSLRFDALAELKARHPALAAWNWGNVYQRPDLQLLAIVLKNRDNWATFAAVRDPEQRLIFSTLAYNRGVGGVQAEMRACKLTAGCDPQRWAGHVERTCTASRQPLYGGRSACDISRAYPLSVIEVRAPKYRGWFA
jgi:hypothetical protein